MVRRLLLMALVVAGLAAVPVPAQATTIFDPDEAGHRLDIRSVSIVELSGDRLQVTLVFWNRTPIHLLRSRAARIELSTNGPHHADGGALYGIRFWPNQSGRLRVTWGEPASSCCGHDGAQHPNAVTYTSPSHFAPCCSPIRSFRATTTRPLTCTWDRRCGLSGGRAIDHTPWTRA